MERTPEVIIRCEYCEHGIDCKRLNPNNCPSMAFTISSSFNHEGNELNIQSYMKDLKPEPYDFMTC